jgi:hypothetical protein
MPEMPEMPEIEKYPAPWTMRCALYAFWNFRNFSAL